MASRNLSVRTVKVLSSVNTVFAKPDVKNVMVLSYVNLPIVK
jgi:hypothetical protein